MSEIMRPCLLMLFPYMENLSSMPTTVTVTTWEVNYMAAHTIWPHICGSLKILGNNKLFSSLQIFRERIVKSTEVE